MNFKECYEKVKNGTATQEERVFVEEEINRAKEVDNILNDEVSKEDEVIEKTNKTEVTKIRKVVRIRQIITTIAIVLVSLALIGGISCGVIFGVAIKNARTSSNLEITDAESMAMDFVSTNHSVAGVTPYLIHSERELAVRLPLKDSRYIFEIEIANGDDKYEIKIDSKNKSIYVDEIKKMKKH